MNESENKSNWKKIGIGSALVVGALVAVIVIRNRKRNNKKILQETEQEQEENRRKPESVLQFTRNAEGCLVADRGFNYGSKTRLNLGSEFTRLDKYTLDLDTMGKSEMAMLLSIDQGEKRAIFSYYNRDNAGTGQINMVYGDKKLSANSESSVYESKKFDVKREEARSVRIKADAVGNKTEVYFNNQLILTAPQAVSLDNSNLMYVYPSLSNALTRIAICQD